MPIPKLKRIYILENARKIRESAWQELIEEQPNDSYRFISFDGVEEGISTLVKYLKDTYPELENEEGVMVFVSW